MCIFSREVEAVARTRIFARDQGDAQHLVYAMDFAAAEDLAMILPLPVSAGAGDDAVRFVDLSGYPTFFEDLQRAFPTLVPQDLSLPRSRAARAPLAVHRVGAFDASFVPSIEDFSRLDARFRLPDTVWSQLPGYAEWGFAVFALHGELGQQTAHPMALTFPTRHPGRLFYPTVHVHDGAVRARAEFDHELYAQGQAAQLDGWRGAAAPAEAFVDPDRARGLVDGTQPLYQRVLAGLLENRDTWA